MAYASRNSSYLLGSIGAVLQVFAGWWDVYTHISFGNVDPWWNPAYFTLYLGVGLVIVAVWRGLRSNAPRMTFVSPIRFVNTSGLKLAGLGSILQIIAGVWNEIVHHAIGVEPKIAPAHALLTIGMLTIALGMIVGLSIEYGMIKQSILIVPPWRQKLTPACVVLIFASIWLTAAGSFIYVARFFQYGPFNWVLAFLLCAVTSFVLVPAKRILPRFGSAIAIGIIFNAVAYLLLVSYGEVPLYVPWGILSIAIFDLSVSRLKHVMRFTRVAIISAAVIGPLFYATYYPFTEYLFPWSRTLDVGFMLVIVGSMVGSVLGNGVYGGLSSLVLGGLSRETST
jgi:hypothetical protein